MNKLKFAFSAPLNEFDNETETYGCRANNPDICNHNSLEGVCAFVRDDCICKQPSKVWKKQYYKLFNQGD